MKKKNGENLLQKYLDIWNLFENKEKLHTSGHATALMRRLKMKRSILTEEEKKRREEWSEKCLEQIAEEERFLGGLFEVVN